jgi:hypothetical protein
VAVEEITETDYRPISFRRVLPIGQLLFCALLLYPSWNGSLRSLFHIHTSRRVVINGDLMMVTPPSSLILWTHDADNAFEMVSAFNAPSLIFQIPSIVLSQDRKDWHPESIDFKAWRAITWPLLALPFWWMAGRGLEAIFAAKRKIIEPAIGWTTTTISFFLMAAGSALGIGFLFAGPDRHDLHLQVFVAGCVMWGVLASFTVVARLAQWRLRRNLISTRISESP